MDLSKLPKLSGDRADAPPPATLPEATPVPHPADFAAPPVQSHAPEPFPRPPAPRRNNLAEAWLSIAIGCMLLLLSPRMIQYVLSPGTFPEKWKFNDGAGNPLAYTQTVYFWGDLALALFALALIFEGIVLGFTRGSIWLLASVGFTALATLANAGYVIYMMNAGYGLQLFSVIAVVFGVYAVIVLWQQYQLQTAR